MFCRFCRILLRYRQVNLLVPLKPTLLLGQPAPARAAGTSAAAIEGERALRLAQPPAASFAVRTRRPSPPSPPRTDSSVMPTALTAGWPPPRRRRRGRRRRPACVAARGPQKSLTVAVSGLSPLDVQPAAAAASGQRRLRRAERRDSARSPTLAGSNRAAERDKPPPSPPSASRRRRARSGCAETPGRDRPRGAAPPPADERRRRHLRVRLAPRRHRDDRDRRAAVRDHRQRRAAAQRVRAPSRRGGGRCAVSGRRQRVGLRQALGRGGRRRRRRSELRSDCVSRAGDCCDVRETRESDDSASVASGSTSCALYTVSSFGAAGFDLRSTTKPADPERGGGVRLGGSQRC